MKGKSLASILTKEALTRAYVEQEMSLEKVAECYHTSIQIVRKYMKIHGISARPPSLSNRKYKFVESSGFLNPVDDWHAYWIGFIAADGHITNTGFLQIGLAQSDQNMLENFLKGVHAENPIYQYKTNNGGMASHVQIRDDKLIESLSKWGITPRKSLTIQWPTTFPIHLYPAFIRGYFDGNGTIFQRYRKAKEHHQGWTETSCRFICGSPPFLNELERTLNLHGIITIKQYQNQGTQAYVLPLSGKKENLKKFASLIYQDCSICLERKREIFASL